MEKNKFLPKIGIKGFHESLVGKVDFFEIDVFDSILKDKKRMKKSGVKIHISANQYFYRDSTLSLEERIQHLVETFECAEVEACTLKLIPSFFERYDVTLLRQFTHQCKKFSKVPLYIDLPQSFPRSLALNSNYIVDPFWHSARRSQYWNVHGWNDVRWVRRYSQSSLQELARWCLKLKPKYLLFSHSQREAQVLEFLNLLVWSETKNSDKSI